MKRERIVSIEERGTRVAHGETIRSVIAVSIYYSKGGVNFATYKREPRGYYLSVNPEERSKSGGCNVVSFMMFGGVKSLVKEAARFSQKALDSIDIAPLAPTIAGMRAQVLAKEESAV